MSKVVAIVGRPNVGKSTLFNRLIGRRKSIVDDESGVTRDRLYDYFDWDGEEFIVIDTGGYVENSDDIFEKEIKKQVELAINESDIILFLVDITVGITDQDEAFTRYLRKVEKPVIVIANKTDSFDKISESYDFYRLGFENVFPVSSINGSGTGDLLDKIVELVHSNDSTSNPLDESGLPRFTIIGKPNVGKSTLINALLGEERNIVTDIPGTTRDSIHSVYKKFGKEFILIDTAGLRKKAKVHEDLEFYSTMRAVTAIEESDVCLLLIDAQEGIQGQDLSILTVVVRRNKGVVILINKWDIVDKATGTAEDYIINFKKKLAPFNDIPIHTISALNKTRIFKSIETALEVFENRKTRISTSSLNNIMLKAIEDFHPPSVKGKMIRIKYVTQIKSSYPIFSFFCNHPQYIKDPYKRYLENKLRASYKFEGVPIKLLFKKK